jgi:hypothetical protein
VVSETAPETTENVIPKDVLEVANTIVATYEETKEEAPAPEVAAPAIDNEKPVEGVAVN